MNISPGLIEFLKLISIISAFGALIALQIKGAAYDAEMGKIHKNYEGSHTFSFRSRYGRLWFGFPLPIFSKGHQGKTEKLRKQFNNIVLVFWIIGVAIALLLFL